MRMRQCNADHLTFVLEDEDVIYVIMCSQFLVPVLPDLDQIVYILQILLRQAAFVFGRIDHNLAYTLRLANFIKVISLHIGFWRISV